MVQLLSQLLLKLNQLQLTKLMFNWILTQFAQVPDALNTKLQQLTLIQWIISFQTSELIIIS